MLERCKPIKIKMNFLRNTDPYPLFEMNKEKIYVFRNRPLFD